jgi:hypothetical protein
MATYFCPSDHHIIWSSYSNLTLVQGQMTAKRHLKYGKTEYIVVFDGNYKQFVYFVTY